MINFEVRDMTCGHCVATITRAVKAVDPAAQVHADLATHRVQIETAAEAAESFAAAIREEGYTPDPVAA